MRGIVAFSLLSLASAAPTLNTGTIHEGVAPLLSASNAVEVPDSYIVVFKEHVDETVASAHRSWIQDVHLDREGQRSELRKRSQSPFVADVFEGLKHTYNIAGSFLGYSGHFDDSVIEQIRRHPDVSLSMFSCADLPTALLSSPKRAPRPYRFRHTRDRFPPPTSCLRPSFLSPLAD